MNTFTFVSDTGARPRLQRLSATKLSRLRNARVVPVPGGVQLCAEIDGRPGNWRLSSPGGLVDVLSVGAASQLLNLAGVTR